MLKTVAGFSHTIKEALFFRRHDIGKVSSMGPALGLSIFPASPGGEVLVAEALEAVPARLAFLQVWKEKEEECKRIFCFCF